MRIIGLIVLVLALGSWAYAASSLVPVIANPGFDDDAGGWAWSVSGANATVKEAAENPHSGNRCAVFTNESGVAPNCYARYRQLVVVLPETEYELSVWARGVDVGGADAGAAHFTDWATYTLNIPTGTFGWQKVTTRFKTNPGQTTLDLGMNLVNKCKELAIDDVSLRPVGTEFKGAGVDGSLVVTKKMIDHDSTGQIAIFASCAKPGFEAEAVVSDAGRAIFEKKAALESGDNSVEWEWNSGTAPFGELTCTVRIIENGKVVASGDATIEKVQSAISLDIDKVEARMKEFNALYDQCKAKGVRLDYPTVAKTTLDQFIPLARQDARDGVDWRANSAVKDFNRTLDDSISEMKAYLADPSIAPVARRYQTGRVDIDGLSLIGDRVSENGITDRGPLFFCGYGHFYGIEKDMPRWPGYGINMVQFAWFGPSAVFPKEDVVDLAPVKQLIDVLDDAAKHNVRVDFLLSPHYFPAWAMQKWPQMTCGAGGFFPYFVDAPEAKAVVEKFLRIVIPMIKDKPALNSFCLSNEPSLENTAGCELTKQQWAEYLGKTHGDVATMNERYGTKYASFDEVPIPGLQAFDDPSYYDWCHFNDIRFAAWHKWEADICHELAPNIPVHAKIQMHNTLFRDIISYGVSPEMIGAATDYNGNDCIFVDRPGPGFSAPWMVQDVCYDIQRSLNLKPIFNSENHPTIDGDTRYVAPDHFRTCLWLGALRGQSLTTFWVWERMEPSNAGSYAFLGNVMDRPGCAEIVGRTCLDFNRFANEMQALQQVKSPVAILFSVASIAKNRDYLWNMENAYTALNFSGIRVDFISEKQLAEGKGKQYKMIILPDSQSVLDSTVDAIKALPDSVRLVYVGESLTKDQYNRPRSQTDVDATRGRSMVFKSFADAETVLCPALTGELEKLGGMPNIKLVDSEGKPLWGVEWLPVQINGRTVISIVSLRTERKTVKVLIDGKQVEARDLLSLGGREPVRTLKANTPILAEVVKQ